MLDNFYIQSVRSEYRTWSREAQYLFDERIGILFNDLPLEQCNKPGIEIALKQARDHERTNSGMLL